MQRIDQEDFLWMDRFTIRNLELLQSTRGDRANPCIEHAGQYAIAHGRAPAETLDHFSRCAICQRINERLDAVEDAHPRSGPYQRLLQQHLKSVGDLERLGIQNTC